MSQYSGPKVFITVGSTKFTDLVKAILSTPVLDALSQAALSKAEGLASITIQFGATPIQDVVFGEKLGLASKDTPNSGSLPIKLLGSSDNQPFDRECLKKVAEALSPEAIKDQLANEDDYSKDALGLKHFSMECTASHGSVYVEFIDYVGSITPHLEKANIVISHAGSGTILEALRMDKAVRPRLIVVPNESLMDNHQAELAKALSERHHVYAARLHPRAQNEAEVVGQLPALLLSLLSTDQRAEHQNVLQDFPPFAPGRFRSLVDEEMGFST